MFILLRLLAAGNSNAGSLFHGCLYSIVSMDRPWSVGLWVKFWEWDSPIPPLFLLDTQSGANHFTHRALVFLCKNGYDGSIYLTGLWQGHNRYAMCWAPCPAQGKPLARVNYHLLLYLEHLGFAPDSPRLPCTPNTPHLPKTPNPRSLNLHSLLWLTLALTFPQSSPTTRVSLPLRTLQVISLAQ